MAKNMYQKRRERKEKTMEENSNMGGCQKNVINWYPGHMAKAKRLIEEKKNIIDVVYEVIDARIPYSSKIDEKYNILNSKPHILIMSKTDLSDPKETQEWIDYYTKKGYYTISFDLSKSNVDFANLIKLTNDIMAKQQVKRNNKGMLAKEIHAIVIGIPNVGKSTFINRFVGRSVASVGNKPGVTTKLTWLKTKSNILLLDSPGILWPKLENEEIALNLAAMSAIKEDIIPIDKVAWHILNKLNDYYPKILNERYKITKLSGNFIDDYDTIGKVMGCKITGGEIDYKRVSVNILNDIKNARIKGITFDFRSK